MRWVEPTFSKTQVKRAGEVLINPEASRDEWTHAMDILSNWRSVHAYPMHAILIFLRRKASILDRNAVVVQRLKRTPSIVGKLYRFGTMKLHRMQDIGGCRAVVKTVKQAESLSNLILNSRTRNKLHKVNDYITAPKDSGYRGIHLVYKYNGQKSQYKDLFVEIQLRSRIQHAWATAVEIVDTFTRQALKASQGSNDWLKFFRYISAEFSRLEKRPIGNDIFGINTLDESKRLAEKLSVVQQLSAFTVSAQHIGAQRHIKAEYYLLELEENAQRIGCIHKK
jgi:ppGpp synthetase/RelA/SpoT-type nucleotidyltranferase